MTGLGPHKRKRNLLLYHSRNIIPIPSAHFGVTQKKWNDSLERNIYFDFNYLITVVNDQPFYLSSGLNSNFKNTWFPFFGMLEQSTQDNDKGWIIKASTHSLPSRVVEKINDICKEIEEYGLDIAYKYHGLLIRFADVDSMIISSILGGGFWLFDSGKQLRSLLEGLYPQKYGSDYLLMTGISIANDTDPELEIKINRWLKSYMYHQSFSELAAEKTTGVHSQVDDEKHSESRRKPLKAR